ncbi:MAG: phosphatase PAP2 family protein [Flavobacterium sp.]|nr:MAG: phosphatase PAP2 family protein [Flavobacterium sp.]
MVDKLLQWDRELFVFLNGLGSDNFDALWLFITKQINWLPVFLLIGYLAFKRLGWRHAVMVIMFIIVLITFTDQTTNLVKYHFQRLRPGNDPEIGQLIRAVQRRNSYSFFSGHASNSMGVAMFLFLILRRYLKYMGLIFLWPLIFAYSRIYLGLHYPIDIMCGYIWGALSGIGIYQLYKLARNKYFPQKEDLDHPTNG